MSERRLAITKRVDLSAVAEGWEGCYAIVSGATYQEAMDLTKVQDSEDNSALLEAGLSIVKKHFISGKVGVLDDAGKTVVEDMLPEDIDNSRDLADLILEAVMGAAPDPKGSSTVTASLSADTSETPSATSA